MSVVLVGAGGRTGERVQVERGVAGPVRFWRGQGRYEVGELIEHWTEAGPAAGPWVEPDGPAAAGPCQVWRVEAVRSGRSRSTFAGVFDLSWEPAGNCWRLVRVHD